MDGQADTTHCSCSVQRACNDNPWNVDLGDEPLLHMNRLTVAGDRRE